MDFGIYLTIGAPEIMMAIGAMALLLIGVILGDRSLRLISLMSIALMLGVAVAVFVLHGEKMFAFHNGFVVDRFSSYVKIAVLLASSVSIGISITYLRAEKLARFEYRCSSSSRRWA